MPANKAQIHMFLFIISIFLFLGFWVVLLFRNELELRAPVIL